MRQVFSETPALRRHAEAFFRTNALAFLNLPRFMRENRNSLTSEERTYLQNLISGQADGAPVVGNGGESAGPGVRPRPTTAGFPGTDPAQPVDFLVLGAGVAGLTAAREMMRNRFGDRDESNAHVNYHGLVLEAANRMGGRIHTLRGKFDVPIEVGAELIHRPKPPSFEDPAMHRFWMDVERYRLTTIPLDKLDNNARSALIHFRQWSDGQPPLIRSGCHACNDPRFKVGIDALTMINGYARLHDQTVEEFLEQYVCGRRGHCDPNDLARAAADYLVTGTVPGRNNELSAASLRFERVKQQHHSGEEYHVFGGYDLLLQQMAHQEQIPIVFGAKVQRVVYAADGVRVDVEDGRRFFGRTAICTFSIGMLKSGQVEFSPPLPDWKLEALDRVDLGPESKVVFEFNNRFWPDTMALLSNPGYDRKGGRSYFVPTYGRTDVDAPILTAFLTREEADDLDKLVPVGGMADETTASPDLRSFIDNRILADLNSMFGKNMNLASDVRQFYCRSWAKDPLALGATSFVRFDNLRTDEVDNIRMALVNASTTRPLYWAGEATATDIQPWSVHGAHSSGVRAARQARGYLRILDR
jgi:monoamine oxidase